MERMAFVAFLVSAAFRSFTFSKSVSGETPDTTPETGMLPNPFADAAWSTAPISHPLYPCYPRCKIRMRVGGRVKPRSHRRFQGMGAPLAAAKREYHSSRLRETETALAQARNRSGRDVPNTGWIFAGCLRSQASRMASAVVS